jgi:hypothetical protein
MANMHNYLEEKLLNYIFRGQNFTRPTTLWIALCEDEIEDDTEMADLPEVEGTGYERKSISCATTAWADPASGDGITSNSEEIKWENVQWEATIKSIAICDAGPARKTGNILFWGDLTKEKVVTQDDSISFAANSLSIQIDN